MKLSLYTFVKDGLFYDYHVVEMLKHHLPLVDEIVVNDGMSTDGTFEAISGIDPKIKVFRSDWGRPNGLDWICRFKNEARTRCTGDWCIFLDCDEFIPEWEFEPLRQFISEQTPDKLFRMNEINFYGNYRVYHTCPEKVPWPYNKVNIHPNRTDVEFWTDGSHVRWVNGDTNPIDVDFTIHHFGCVRDAARLRERWRNILGNLYSERKRWCLPRFLFNLRPHRWDDPAFVDDLAVFEGPYVKAVRDNTGEFIRDKLFLYELLRQRQSLIR